jgi:hypothetical protein
MKVNRDAPPFTLESEDGERLTVRYSNRGEPYRQGVSLTFWEAGYGPSIEVFLYERHEVERLRDALTEFLNG